MNNREKNTLRINFSAACYGLPRADACEPFRRAYSFSPDPIDITSKRIGASENQPVSPNAFIRSLVRVTKYLAILLRAFKVAHYQVFCLTDLL